MSASRSPLFGLLALVYLASLTLAPYPGQFIVKALPILLLLVLTWGRPGVGIKWLTTGLGFSAIADMLLTLDGDHWFMAGIAVFGLAQASYAAAFWANRSSRPGSWLRAMPVLGLAVGLTGLLLPHLGTLLPAVLGYIVIIVLAGLSATRLPFQMTLSYFGMLIFMVSDATIALNRFMVPIPGSDWIIMSTYYAAQWMIVSGLVAQQSATARRTSGIAPDD